ncbi:hypothetical protein F4815DRAFT_450134 [Daldinia loculata]|nr:hypothetical protein F4815DRAFT_450134 [Daldinia loculata]
MSFPAFLNLPAEVQVEIWREYILDANKNRLILMDNYKKQILPTRFLTSPALQTSFLARKIYLDMYPVQLPVFRSFRESTFLGGDEDAEDVEDVQSEGSISPITPIDSNFTGVPCGYVYVNFQSDIFVIDVVDRSDFDFDVLKFTESLNPNQYGLIKQLKVVSVTYRGSLPPIHDLARKNKHRFYENEFSGCQTCQHVYVFWDGEECDNDFDQYSSLLDDLLTLSGEEFSEKWDSFTFVYEGVMLRKSRH